MKRGIFFTIEAVMVVGLIAIILFGQNVNIDKNHDFELAKNSINTITATYTDHNFPIINETNTYCNKAITFDFTKKIYKTNIVCGGFK